MVEFRRREELHNITFFRSILIGRLIFLSFDSTTTETSVGGFIFLVLSVCSKKASIGASYLQHVYACTRERSIWWN